MDCMDIEKKLSAYLEGISSSEEKAFIDEHLASCRKCGETLADLKKTIEYLKGLEEIEPPPWLTQKVMARVKSAQKPKKKFLHRLFYPLHIKLPLEAVTIVLMISLTLYIHKEMRPDVKLAHAPTEEITSRDLPRQVQPLPPSVREPKKTLLHESAFPPKPTEPPAAPDEKYARSGKTESAPEVKSEFEEKQIPVTSVPAKERDGTETASGLAKDQVRRKNTEVAPSAALSLKAKADKKVLNLILIVKNPETAAREIEDIIRDFEGKLIRSESSEGKIIITAGTSTAKMKDMVEKLKSVGEVKAKFEDFEWTKGDVGLRISVVEDNLSFE